MLLILLLWLVVGWWLCGGEEKVGGRSWRGRDFLAKRRVV